MRFTLLADLSKAAGFKSEFGLSLLLENDGGRWLFDTGSSDALIYNSRKLNIAETALKKVILSHGHYDHTGGLAALKPEMIYAAAGVDSVHYSKHADGEMHHISMPEDSRKVFEKFPVTLITGFSEISPGIFLSGAIPRISGEDCGGDFFHDIEAKQKDIVPEEQFLLTADGILVTGCCHAGIINSLEFCCKCHPEIAVRAIVGGLHLRHAGKRRLTETAEYLRASSVKELYIGHCTGENAIEYLKTALPECRIVTPLPGETWEI